MNSSYVLLFGLVISVAIILSEAQKRSAKKKKGKAKQINEFAPDSEVGTSCFDSCFPTASNLEANGRIKNPKQYGEFTEVCGKTYLFGTKKVSWEENWKTCCSIGMMPIVFDSRAEFDCMSTSASNGKIPALNGNNEFWAGGFLHGLTTNWHWCTKDSPDPIEDDLKLDLMPPPLTREEKKNGIKSPYAEHKCARLKKIEELMKLTFSLCDAKSVNLACVSVEKIPENLLPSTKCRANCEKLNCAVVKKTHNDQQEQRLKERYKNGRWISKSARYLMVSNNSATYEEARKKCCSYGMNLVSLKTNSKRSTLSAIAKEYPDTAGDYWTSGSDAECEGNYRWCSVDRAFVKSEVQWAKGQPKSSVGNCVWLKMSKIGKETSLNTGKCTKKKKYICELRQSGTTVQAVQKECIEFLGLTPQEVSDLKNINKFNYKMKCFLKCVGDNIGLIVDGYLQDGNLMRIMESSNNEDDNTQVYSAIDECQEERDPNDSCESAYKMYKCAKEKAPVVFGKLVVWEDATSQSGKAPVEIPMQRTCFYLTGTVPTINRASISSLQSSGKTPEGGVSITGWNKKKWYKSQYSASHSYKDAYAYCASIQMRLPLAKTVEDFKAMYDFMNGATTDNFYLETRSAEGGVEKWCTPEDDLVVPPAISADKFRLLSEPSLLVSKKGTPKYTLTPVKKYQLASSVTVNHFFCEPVDEEQE